MYALYVGFILLIVLIAFIFVCAAGFFNWIGNIVIKFIAPFKQIKNNKEENEKNE